MPLLSPYSQSGATTPASTSRVMSGASENATTSAASPASTARLCSPELPYDWSNSTPAPSSVDLKASISFAYASRGVE